MKENKLIFAHLCDNAIISRDDGKISVIGIFQEIISKKKEVIHPRMVLVYELFLANKENHDLRVEFKDPIGNDFHRQYEKNISTPDPRKNIGQILNIVNINLKEEGTYKIEFFIDNINVGNIKFDFVVNN